jgi:soluble lytic murein transglycosylase-like protein
MGISIVLAEAYGYQAEDIQNASINVRIGTRFLAQLLKQFDGDLHRALAAYQAGPGKVLRSRGIPNDKGVKDFLAAFEKAYHGPLEPVRIPGQSLAGEIKAEIQEEALDLVVKVLGNPRVARYRRLIQKMANKFSVDAGLMEAMIMNENPWGDPSRISRAGAVGLGQLMPDTASWLGVIDSFNPVQNLRGMAKYLKYLLNKYDGNKILAVAAYNAGEHRVDRAGRIHNFRETKKYVQRVMRSYSELTGRIIDPTPYMPNAKRHGSRSRA